ncbi:hypothetical protein [Scytonema sp. PCC 10023]
MADSLFILPVPLYRVISIAVLAGALLTPAAHLLQLPVISYQLPVFSGSP